MQSIPTLPRPTAKQIRVSSRFRLGIPLLMAGLLLSGGANATAAAALARDRRPVRHMIVVENTKNMDRQREQSADIVSRLILQGFGQRARPGDGVELWLVDDQVRTQVFERFTWDRLGAVDRSNLAFRLLRDLRPKGSTAVVGRAVSTVGATNAASGPTLVYLVTSGTDSLLGTPYDEQVNSLFFQHREAMRKARNPFVTVLAAQDGAWVGHSITPGDRTPFIPPFPAPKPPEVPPVVAPKADASPQPSPAPVPATNTPSPLSVEEISRQIREQAAEKARQKAPSISAHPAPAASVTPPEVGEQAPATPSDPPVDMPPTSGLPVPPPLSSKGEPLNDEAATVESFLPLDGKLFPSHQEEPAASLSPSARALPTMESDLSLPPATTGGKNQGSIPPPGLELLVGLLLLSTAGGIGLLLIRVLRHRRSPSLITESFQRLRDPQQPYTGSRR